MTTAGGWDDVAATVHTLPDDTQGVYLLLARVYGTGSPARTRRVLSFLERQGAVVICPEAHDWRAVALPGLGWRTAPGNPAAPDLLD